MPAMKNSKGQPATTRKTTTKKAAPVEEVQADLDDLRDLVLDALKSGELDYALVAIDDAVSDRIDAFNKQQAAAKKKTAAAKKESGEKVVPKPTRKPAAAVVPEVNKQYAIDEAVKTHGGKKGKFLRFFKGDSTKSVLDVGEAKPIVVPTARLTVARGARRPKK